ncbi:MAG: GNAT family N-acetyltransferase, partial [Oscillospiraceae bacterium]|nr:GNAT family N-acetyltransferase [Oscillospiraceae bacterium]
ALEHANDGRGPKYVFYIKAGGEWVGWVHVKVYYSIRCRHDGQIGYMIDDEKNRNRGYATKALLALRPFLRRCGFKKVLINTDIDNPPSRRVCEKVGARLVEVFDTPTWTGIYAQGQRQGCKYEWDVGGE